MPNSIFKWNTTVPATSVEPNSIMQRTYKIIWQIRGDAVPERLSPHSVDLFSGLLVSGILLHGPHVPQPLSLWIPVKSHIPIVFLVRHALPLSSAFSLYAIVALFVVCCERKNCCPHPQTSREICAQLEIVRSSRQAFPAYFQSKYQLARATSGHVVFIVWSLCYRREPVGHDPNPSTYSSTPLVSPEGVQLTPWICRPYKVSC